MSLRLLNLWIINSLSYFHRRSNLLYIENKKRAARKSHCLTTFGTAPFLFFKQDSFIIICEGLLSIINQSSDSSILCAVSSKRLRHKGSESSCRRKLGPPIVMNATKFSL